MFSLPYIPIQSNTLSVLSADLLSDLFSKYFYEIFFDYHSNLLSGYYSYLSTNSLYDSLSDLLSKYFNSISSNSFYKISSDSYSVIFAIFSSHYDLLYDSLSPYHPTPTQISSPPLIYPMTLNLTSSLTIYLLYSLYLYTTQSPTISITSSSK